MIKLLRFTLLASALFLTACSTFTELTSDLKDKVMGKEPPNPPAVLEEFKQTYTAKVIWSSKIGDTNRYDFTPALEAGYVYGADAEGDLLKLDAPTGKQIWRVKATEPISGGVGAGGGLVLVGSNKGNVLAFDLNGKQLWKSKVSSEILSAPRYFDGNVIVRTGDNHIYGIDAADGTRKWVYERTNPALSLRSSAGLIVDGGAVYAGFSGGKMVAIRADNGKLLWEATVAQPKGVTEIERIADITSLPVVDGPVVFAVAYQGRVAAVDRTNGKVIWNRDISSYAGINIEDGRLYVTHSLGSVYALDYSTSKTFWRQPALLNRRLTAPLPMGNLVAVGDLEGYVHFLNRDDGSFASRIKVDGDPVMSLIQGSSASQLIAATRGGSLYAVSVTEVGASPNVKPEEAKKPSEPAPAEQKSEERSILFRDNPLLPDTQDSGPGIRLPSSEPQ
ncbi:MAG: outer membrane protein assembly factor BamB [Methylophilaceae bacterium]